MPAPAKARLLLLLALLALFAGLKSQHDLHWTQARDGRFYTDIARQVMQGEGLTTRVSNYNQGYREWPARTNQAPLWPLTFGTSARAIGLETAAQRLPQAFYLLDLLLLYFLANRIWRRIAGRPAAGMAGSGLPDFGHLAVALFGANAVFFRFTSLPMTEGMAFGLTFAALICVDRAVGEGGEDPPRIGWAAATGAIATLALLTRGQLLVVPVAVMGGLVLAGLGRPGGWRLPAAAIAAGFVVLTPWVLYLSSWIEDLTLMLVLGFGTGSNSIGLPAFDFWVQTDGMGAYLLDRWGGVVTAFDPRNEDSYFASFGLPVLLVPVAAAFAAAALVRQPARLRRWLAPEYALVWTALALAVGSLLPVHHAHSVVFRPWFFGFRHGLPFLYALLPALAFLLSRPQLAVRATAATLAGIGVLHGAWALRDELPGESESAVLPVEEKVGAWLDGRGFDPIVVYWDPTIIPIVSKRSTVHWTACDQPADSTQRLIEEAGVHYVIARFWLRECPFLDAPGLRVVKRFKGPNQIWIYASENAPRPGNTHRP